MLIFIRTRHLTEYLVHKHFRLEHPSVDHTTSRVGDKLYSLCSEVLRTNRTALENFLPDVVFRGKKKSLYPATFFSLMKRVLQDCHMGRVILVFNSCLICCEVCRRKKETEDLVEEFVMATAHALLTQRDWIKGNDFTKVFFVLFSYS